MLASSARADYLAGPIRWLDGFPAGGSNDITAHILAPRLSTRFGRQVGIDRQGPIPSDTISSGLCAANSAAW